MELVFNKWQPSASKPPGTPEGSRYCLCKKKKWPRGESFSLGQSQREPGGTARGASVSLLVGTAFHPASGVWQELPGLAGEGGGFPPSLHLAHSCLQGFSRSLPDAWAQTTSPCFPSPRLLWNSFNTTPTPLSPPSHLMKKTPFPLQIGQQVDSGFVQKFFVGPQGSQVSVQL